VQLTPHFTLEELTFSEVATVHAIDNNPPQRVLENMQTLAGGLEQIRAILGQPLHISSGFRCPALNGLVRGVPRSAHVTGFAADFICPAFGTPAVIVSKLADGSLSCFDQLIQEGTWVHVSFAPPLRRQVLTAHFVDGQKTTYTPD
jgi:hypothetical protein